MSVGAPQFPDGAFPGNGHNNETFKDVCQSFVTFLYNFLFCFDFGLLGILFEHS